MRSHMLFIASIALLIACVSTNVVFAEDVVPTTAPDGEPWNFVVILIDDMGWMDLTCQGSQYFETPNIDRLAADGMTFTNGYAACAVCSPTRAAFQTGRYPARVGVTDWIRSKFQGGNIIDGQNPTGFTSGNQPLHCPKNALFMELDEVTLAEVLGPAGYTSCFIGKWHLGQTDQYPEAQGYDFNIGGCDLGQPPSYFDPYDSGREFYKIPTMDARSEGEYLTDREADEAAAFILDHSDEPFLLNLCHYAVHTPLQAKRDLIDKYDAKEKTEQTNATYAAMVESVDDSIGAVLDAIEEAGVADRTFILFTSDNGGLLGPTNNTPLRSGKGFPYEGGIREPFFVKWPGVVEPGSTCDTPVCSIDVLPTLADASGAAMPEDRAIDGISLVPLLAGEATESGDVFDRPLFWHFPHYRGGLGPYSIVRVGDWKLIKRYDPPKFELYNLADDLSETTDLATQRPAIVSDLNMTLEDLIESTDARMPIINPEYKPDGASEPQPRDSVGPRPPLVTHS